MLVFAGLAVSESGGIALDPEHFLLGLIQQSPATIARFALPEWPVTRLQGEVSRALKDYPRPREGAEFSLSDRTNRLLVSAWEVALEAGSASVRPEDLLRALTSDRGPSGNLLRQAGITPEKLASSLSKQSK